MKISLKNIDIILYIYALRLGEYTCMVGIGGGLNLKFII